MLAERLRPRVGRYSGRSQGRPWEEGGALSGALNPRYAKIRDVLQEKHQQSRVANDAVGGGVTT